MKSLLLQIGVIESTSKASLRLVDGPVGLDHGEHLTARKDEVQDEMATETSADFRVLLFPQVHAIYAKNWTHKKQQIDKKMRRLHTRCPRLMKKKVK